jgi:phage-related minor tail protein
MDEEIDRLVIAVRADTRAFAKDVEDMRGTLDGPLAAGADKAGRTIEASLLRALRTGKFGFEDLARVALSVLDQIARQVIHAGLDQIGVFGGGGGGGGLLGGIMNIAGAIFGGAPGRATGGPVTAGRPYRVGENGPELFVPGSHGRIIAAGSQAGGGAGCAGDDQRQRAAIGRAGGAGEKRPADCAECAVGAVGIDFFARRRGGAERLYCAAGFFLQS